MSDHGLITLVALVEDFERATIDKVAVLSEAARAEDLFLCPDI